MVSDLRQNWADFLGRYEWHEFVTATFNQTQRDVTRAVNMWRAFNRKRILDHAVKVGDITKRELPFHDSQYRKTGHITRYRGPLYNTWRRGKKLPIWVLGIERHSNGSNHLHGLIHHQVYRSQIRRDAGWNIWFNEFSLGRIRIEQPNSQNDVKGYVSKYIAKAGEIELSDNFSTGFRKPSEPLRP